MIGVRFALYGVLGSLFGLSAFALYGLRTGERGDALALRPWLVVLTLLGLAFSAVQLALLAASMMGAPPWPVDREAVGMLLTGSLMGTAWKARMAALLVAGLAAAAAVGRGARLGVVTVDAGIALATLAWTGHGAMGEGASGWVHLIADLLHLLASGAWVGALLGLILLVMRPAARVDAFHLTLTHRALHGFGLVGAVVVGAIVVTGLINSWILVGIGNVADLAIVGVAAVVLVMSVTNRPLLASQGHEAPTDPAPSGDDDDSASVASSTENATPARKEPRG